ncbi:MAG TPA: hypothetical protein VK666_22580 [Chryseolinea sp.]|nr:hypothetical protein [Chryseolinea sp.]
MDALLIRADLECTSAKNNQPFSLKFVEKYNCAISLNQYKEYFEAITRQAHKGCAIISNTMRVSQIDERGKIITDPSEKNSTVPLWEVVYPE